MSLQNKIKKSQNNMVEENTPSEGAWERMENAEEEMQHIRAYEFEEDDGGDSPLKG